MPLYEGVSALDFRKRFDVRINYQTIAIWIGEPCLGHRALSFAPKTPCFWPPLRASAGEKERLGPSFAEKATGKVAF